MIKEKEEKRILTVLRWLTHSIWIKAALFFAIFFILLSGIQFVFQAKWDNDSNTYARGRLFYQEDPAPDVVLIGSSHVYYGINPLLMFQTYGITSYDFSVPNQGAEVTYLFAKEAIRTCSPKVIGISVSTLYDLLHYEERTRQWLDPVPLSLSKIKIAQAILKNNEYYHLDMEADSFMSYLFPLLRYHNRWSSLTENDFILDQTVPCYHQAVHYHGFGPRFNTEPLTFDHYNDDWSYNEEVAKEAKKYYKKIVDICNKNGTKLFLFETPTTYWREGKYILINEWAKEAGIDFIDFNHLMDEMNIDPSTDFCHVDHVNDSGATKVSLALGEYLTGTYSLTDHRKDPTYKSWNDDWEIYQRDKAAWYLSNETDWSNYLEKMQDPNYTIYMAAMDSLGGDVHPEFTEQLKTIGLTPELDTAGRMGYMAIIDGGEVVYEHLEDAPVSYETDINGHHIALISESWLQGNRSSIQLDWKECGVNRRGLNIVVYDNILEDVVDSVTFDFCGGGKVYR